MAYLKIFKIPESILLSSPSSNASVSNDHTTYFGLTPNIWHKVFLNLPILDRANLSIAAKPLARLAASKNLLVVNLFDLSELSLRNTVTGTSSEIIKLEVRPGTGSTEYNNMIPCLSMDTLYPGGTKNGQILFGLRVGSDFTKVQVPELGGDPSWCVLKKDFQGLGWFYSSAAKLIIAAQIRHRLHDLITLHFAMELGQRVLNQHVCEGHSENSCKRNKADKKKHAKAERAREQKCKALDVIVKKERALLLRWIAENKERLVVEQGPMPLAPEFEETEESLRIFED